MDLKPSFLQFEIGDSQTESGNLNVAFSYLSSEKGYRVVLFIRLGIARGFQNLVLVGGFYQPAGQIVKLAVCSHGSEALQDLLPDSRFCKILAVYFGDVGTNGLGFEFDTSDYHLAW